MIIERTFDINEINAVFKHHALIDYLCDDFCGDVEYPIVDQVIYLAAKIGGKMAGLIMLLPQNSIALDSHIAFLPEFHGPKTKQLGKMAIQWVKDNTGYRKINASIPDYNKHVIKYVQDLGYKEEGVCRKSFMKNNKLIDLIHFGLELK